MKKVFFLIINILLFLLVKGQTISPEVVATSGDFFSTSSVSLSWTCGEIMTETFTGSNIILTQGFQQPARTPVISGQLTYRNAFNTAVGGTKVYLKTLLGAIVDSTVTLSNGNFRFYNTPPGTYVFKVKVTKPWGGVNSADALLVTKYFVTIITLTDLYLAAADVNNSTSINSIDALLISKRFTGVISSFALSDWLYMADVIILGAIPLVHNLKVICAGDVNGSYIPAP